MPGSKDGTLESVAVVARILEGLAAAPSGMGVSELARALGESKGRTYRNLTSLKRCGLVDQDAATDGYRLGWKLYQLGERALQQFDLKRLAAPYLERLRDLAGQTALLAVPLNGEAMVVAAVENDAAVSITVKPGNRPAPHCSAQGRVALAWASEQQQARLLGGALRKLTPHSLTDRAKLRSRLKLIRERLFEEAPSEAMIGINVLAAPVLRDGSELSAIVSIIGSVQDIPSPPHRQQLMLVQGCAAALSEALGGEPYRQKRIEVPQALRVAAAERR